ncbi:hypothetical protein SAMN02746000_00323 [Paracoccus sp. J56]|nr:hypothetical protein SAMN02746000_00323 [Paracoccus sp. J56]
MALSLGLALDRAGEPLRQGAFQGLARRSVQSGGHDQVIPGHAPC